MIIIIIIIIIIITLPRLEKAFGHNQLPISKQEKKKKS